MMGNDYWQEPLCSYLLVCRFLTQSLDTISYAEVGWSRCLQAQWRATSAIFTLFLFIANPRSLAHLDDALSFS